MNRVSVGSTYIANWAYSGENSRGKYEMLKVSSEKKNEDITIFVNNVPSGIAKGERFVLNKITGMNIWELSSNSILGNTSLFIFMPCIMGILSK